MGEVYNRFYILYKTVLWEGGGNAALNNQSIKREGFFSSWLEARLFFRARSIPNRQSQSLSVRVSVCQRVRVDAHKGNQALYEYIPVV